MCGVTPHAGVWIEILQPENVILLSGSLPMRECGLKYNRSDRRIKVPHVTPHAGVWIEIFRKASCYP